MSGELAVSAITHWEDLESIRAFWEAEVNHPNAGYHQYRDVLAGRPSVLSPYILCVREDSDLKAIVLCRLEKTPCPISIGYTSIAAFSVTSIVVMHGGVIGHLDNKGAGLVVEALNDAMQRGIATRLWFNGLAEESSFGEAMMNSSNALTRGFQIERSPHWIIEIPEERGGFLGRMKSKHRNFLRRTESKLNKQYPESVKFVCYRWPDDLERALEDVESVAKKTYQRALGKGPRDDSDHAHRFSEASREGRLRVWILYAGDCPRAFRIGLVYGDTIHGGGIGFDPELKQFRLGNLLLKHSIDDLSDEGIRRYDLGLGDSSYKQQFGTISHTDLFFSVYRLNLRSLLVIAVTGSSYHLNRLGKQILERLKLADRAKKWLRMRAASNQQSGRKSAESAQRNK